MNWMTANNRWVLALVAPCVGVILVCPLNSKVQAQPVSQRTQQIAQASCSAQDLSRSRPPFRCITPAMFGCLKRNNTAGGGSLEYKGGNNGDIVVKSNVAGAVALLGFRFDTASQTLDLGVKKKNFAVSEQQIWDGFKDTIAKCRQNPGHVMYHSPTPPRPLTRPVLLPDDTGVNVLNGLA